MDSDLFMFLMYIGSMQVAIIIMFILFFWKKGFTKQAHCEPQQTPQPQQAKVMLHYENGATITKDGIIEGDIDKAIKGDAKAYLHANGNKYTITANSFYQNNTLHVMEKGKPETTKQAQPKPQTKEDKVTLTPEEAEELYEKWKDLDPKDVQVLKDNYLKNKRRGGGNN